MDVLAGDSPLDGLDRIEFLHLGATHDPHRHAVAPARRPLAATALTVSLQPE